MSNIITIEVRANGEVIVDHEHAGPMGKADSVRTQILDDYRQMKEYAR